MTIWTSMELFVNTRPTKQLPSEEDRAETARKNSARVKLHGNSQEAQNVK